MHALFYVQYIYFTSNSIFSTYVGPISKYGTSPPMYLLLFQLCLILLQFFYSTLIVRYLAHAWVHVLILVRNRFSVPSSQLLIPSTFHLGLLFSDLDFIIQLLFVCIYLLHVCCILLVPILPIQGFPLYHFRFYIFHFKFSVR
jgi:hypothetical protein